MGSCHSMAKVILLKKKKTREWQKQTELVKEKVRQKQTHNREKGTKKLKILMDGRQCLCVRHSSRQQHVSASEES